MGVSLKPVHVPANGAIVTAYVSTMTSPKKLESTVRRIAFSLPEVQEGIVCNRAAFEAGKKRFLFLEATEDSCLVMLKLGASLAEARKLATTWSDCYKVGGHNWVTATFSGGKSPPPGLLQRWIEESYRLLVPQKLVGLLKPAARQARSKGKADSR